MLDRSVLPRCVEPLQNEEEGPARLGPQPVVQIPQPLDQQSELLECLLLAGKAQPVGRIALAQAERVVRPHAQRVQEIRGLHCGQVRRSSASGSGRRVPAASTTGEGPVRHGLAEARTDLLGPGHDGVPVSRVEGGQMTERKVHVRRNDDTAEDRTRNRLQLRMPAELVVELGARG